MGIILEVLITTDGIYLYTPYKTVGQPIFSLRTMDTV